MGATDRIRATAAVSDSSPDMPSSPRSIPRASLAVTELFTGSRSLGGANAILPATFPLSEDCTRPGPRRSHHREQIPVAGISAQVVCLARNHALVDGNKRLAWTACRTFLAIHGQWISAPEDERFDFVIRVATGVMPDLDTIAEQLRA